MTVTPQGEVTAVKRGRAVVTGTSEGITGESHVTVHFRLTSVSAGGSASCGLTDKGQAYCWGQNADGLLGIGMEGPEECGGEFGFPRPCSLTPRPVVGGIHFTSVTGGVSSCGLDEGGSVYCWGSNRSGQLGLGDRFDRSEPTRVPFVRAMRAVYVAAHSCALTVTDEALCWGSNDRGQIGDGTTEDRLRPVKVSGGLKFASLAVGVEFTCAITDTGATYCWGSDERGQLGIGGGGPDLCGELGNVPCALAPRLVSGGLSFVQLAVATHACGLTGAGVAYCWGPNTYGQLGDGTENERTVPTEVDGGLTFESISAGGFHTCGLAADRRASCWGANFAGQLGIGTIDGDRTTPSLVLRVEFDALGELGGSNSCGIGSDGEAYCWGSNFAGALGDGTIQDRGSPVLVAGQ